MKIKVSNSWYRKVFDNYFGEYLFESLSTAKKTDEEIRFILKTLKPRKNEKILDVPCGIGRHSLKLAQKGFNITGVDLTRSYISKAKKSVKESFKANSYFEVGNMMNLKKYKSKYDIVLNLFTSIGYFPTEKENEKVIKNLIDCLKPGGRIIFQSICRDFLLKSFSQRDWYVAGKYFHLEERQFDKSKKYVSGNWFLIDRKKGLVKEFSIRNRIYGKNELVKLMKKYGLKNIRVYGDTKGNPYDKSKTHPLYVGVKK